MDSIDRLGSIESTFMGDGPEAPVAALPPTVAMHPPVLMMQPPAQSPPAPPVAHHTWLDRMRLHVGAWWAGVRARMHHHGAATLPPAAQAAPPPAIGVEFGALDSENPALIVGCDSGCAVDTRLRG